MFNKVLKSPNAPGNASSKHGFKPVVASALIGAGVGAAITRQTRKSQRPAMEIKPLHPLRSVHK